MMERNMNMPGEDRPETIAELLADPSLYECDVLAAGGDGAAVIDAGLSARGGWRVGRLALGALYGGHGCANYGRLETARGYLPSVDSFLDNAAAAAKSFLAEDGRGVRGGRDDLGVRLVDRDDRYVGDVSPARSEIVFAPGSFLHHILRAGGVLPRAVAELLAAPASFAPDDLLWAWGKAPLVFRRRDEEALRQYQDQALAAAAVSSIWLRSDDEKLTAFCRLWQGPGELRLHNVQSGNTFIAGTFDGERVWALYAEN